VCFRGRYDVDMYNADQVQSGFAIVS
jgi:hypothetical protein